jgi:hypothetical protein
LSCLKSLLFPIKFELQKQNREKGGVFEKKEEKYELEKGNVTRIHQLLLKI